MSAQTRRGLRVLAAFVGAMAALTFLSDTLYSATLPRVRVEEVQGGTLKIEVSSADLRMDAERIESLRIDQKLADAPLRVASVPVQALSFFEAGDALIAFDPVVGEYALDQAQRARQDAANALTAWNVQWQQAWNELQLEAMEVEADGRDPNADPAVIAQRWATLEDKRQALEQEKIVDGVYQRGLEADCRAADTLASCLEELQAAEWRMLAAEDGFVSEVFVQSGEDYKGLEPVLTWIPASDPSIRVGVRCDLSVRPAMLEDVCVAAVARGADQASQVEWTFAGVSQGADGTMLWARTAELPAALAETASLCFEMRSEYSQFLVPNAAVIAGERLYKLEVRTGAWGREETVAREVRFTGAESDDTHTALPDGAIYGNDQVIVQWDRPIQDGDVVFVQ